VFVRLDTKRSKRERERTLLAIRSERTVEIYTSKEQEFTLFEIKHIVKGLKLRILYNVFGKLNKVCKLFINLKTVCKLKHFFKRQDFFEFSLSHIELLILSFTFILNVSMKLI
jgi:hypothetical protein